MDNPLEAKSEDSRALRDLLQFFTKARKNLKLYPSNNPVYIKTVDEIYSKFRDFIAHNGDMSLRISRNEISYGTETVYEGAGKDDNLALLFFRDGLRELVFKEGLKKEELTDFLSILSVDFDREDVEDDLVTLLWGKDFQHIAYKVDEAMLVEDSGEYAEKAKEQATEGGSDGENSLKQAYTDAFREETVENKVIMQITENDLKAVMREIEKEALDRKTKIIEIIFDMIEHARDPEEFKDLAQIICNALDFMIKQNDLSSTVVILGKAKALIGRATSEKVRTYLSSAVTYAGSLSIFKPLGALIESTSKIDEEALYKFMSLLGTRAIPSLLYLLGEVKSQKGRELVMRSLAMLGKLDIGAVAKGLKDERWAFVVSIIQILRAIGDKAAVDHLVKVVTHTDVRVKKEALRALGEMGGDRAIEFIVPFLNNEDQILRVAALKSLGSTASDTALSVLLDRIGSKRVLDFEFEEMKVHFEVLSRWKDSGVVDFLIKIINERSLFNRAKLVELKLAAIYGLGLIGSKDAMPALEKIRDAGNKPMADYANMAMKRIVHGK